LVEQKIGFIVGSSPSLARVLEQVRCVAPTTASVLLWGETGTGKELVARAIHSLSERCGKPFVKVNCAALPAGLIESELFGHERGAFTGALHRRTGRFELAHRGTIFLDEIGELPRDAQGKLLRVLQEREFERVGGGPPIPCDVRIVSATNRVLQAAVADGSFRADLYYRLNVFPIDLPPLRERRSDIPDLVSYFLRKHSARLGRCIDSVEAQSMQRLLAYRWPGNVRELDNIIERALILCKSSVLHIEPEVMGYPSPPFPAFELDSPSEECVAQRAAKLDSIQRQHILNTLQNTHWVVEGRRGAAIRLGLKPATLRHRMKRLGIVRRTPQMGVKTTSTGMGA
jgi:transcriptional regulator with GAF, ATPase, and Fis domain